MSIIQAYKSDADGRIFEYEQDYKKHLRKLAAIRRKEKKQEERENLRQLIIETMRTECGSFGALEKYLLKHWDEMGAEDSKLMGIKFSEMEWRDSISNTHDCPKSGVTNWWSKSDLPSGYPGGQGRINVRIIADTLGYDFALARLGIHTGTGGGGYYDVKIFADDFPGLTKEIMWEKLAK